MVDSVMTFIVPFLSVIGSVSTFGLFPDADQSSVGERQLSFGSNSLLAFQVFLAAVGVVIALTLHFFKMLVRLLGEGWLTGCLAILEDMWTICTVCMAIFIKPVSIVFAIVICLTAIYAIQRLYKKRKERRERNAESSSPRQAIEQPNAGGGDVEVPAKNWQDGKSTEDTATNQDVEAVSTKNWNDKPVGDGADTTPVVSAKIWSDDEP
eukprot:Plantae.Rhodophyta-Palmaria_palmata.ctg16171.p1 GENE.Plantae.Rhodophyta-Palmaria_palmata.ctg16171~~Plantae.Rhodophyta-Palmaria_palmata.ctg16171.p1  ORF type:complete len:220 (-),score=40.84 Plantae.Rhodophyta-Palmaria_palmata.ctg16171:43-669(-)